MPIYNALRRETFVLGITDKDYPRTIPPIKASDDIRNVSYGRLLAAIREEIGIITLDKKATQHEIESLGREKEMLEAMVNRAYDVFGIERKKLKP